MVKWTEFYNFADNIKRNEIKEKPMEYKLTDIKDWYKKNNQLIPEIQRDLVWAPKQIVMLWDSILRGFPIGSFIILEKENSELQILDGQQRINAIAQGFGTYSICSENDKNRTEEPDVIVWLDLCRKKQGTKVYPLMITTKSQPWGFNYDDECSKLSANERRDSLKGYGITNDYDIYNRNISLYRTWPYKAIMPMPLQIMLNHISDDEVDFANNIMEELKASQFDVYEKKVCGNQDEWTNKLRGFYDCFRKLKYYSIGKPTVSDSVFRLEGNDLEILFHRINRGGTRMSDDDLAYSSIKAYYGGIGIKEKDPNVSNYITPAKLARLLFRIADSVDKDSFVGDFEPKKIREYSNNANFIKRITDYYSNVDEIINLIESIFDKCSIPKVLRIDIANKSTALYMLLVYLALFDDELKDNEEKQRYVCGLVFYLNWFCDNIPLAVNVIKTHFVDNDFSVTKIKMAISEIIGLNILIPILKPDELAFDIKADDKWAPRFKAIELWNRIRDNRNLLLFFQRDYLKDTFGNYNPVNSKLWDDNRPWDYDHIIPQNWFGNYSSVNKYARFNKYWMNNIGNLAAIPFERNRSKSDNGDWGYYEKTGLLDRKAIIELEEINPREFNSDENIAIRFATTTFNRCHSIYVDCFDYLLKSLILTKEDDLVDVIQNRKRLLQKMLSSINDTSIYFVTKDASKEEQLTLNKDESLATWCMPWLSCGKIKGNYYIALAIGFSESLDRTYYEIGIRRKPGDNSINQENKKDWRGTEKYGYITYDNGWYHIEKDITDLEANSIDFIKKEFEYLEQLLN